MPPLTPSPQRDDEFPPGASEWPSDLSRRRFLEVVGASLALAGLAGCDRLPVKTIVPYTTPPERDLLHASVYYATAMPWDGYARGVLALSRSGRPTKIEGNPAHPDSQGATDLLMQASVLSLYDPDRSRVPLQDGHPTSWDAFEDYWLRRHRELLPQHGRGLALLTEPTTSPTELRAIHHLLDRFPDARWYQHSALPRYDRGSHQPDYDVARADVILALDADFLFSHPSSLRYAREFAQRRRIEHGKVNANRLYAFESAPSVTGAMADHHLPVSPGRLPLLLRAIDAQLADQHAPDGLTDEEKWVLRALVHDLRAQAPRVLCVAGETADPAVQRWADALNARLGADGVTHHALPVVRSDADPRAAGGLGELVAAMRGDQVDTLVIAGANPLYTATPDLDFPGAFARVRHRIHVGTQVDETGVRCGWHLPESHYLEAWGDLRAYDGTLSFIQPLISPLYASRSAAEVTWFLAEGLARSDYDLVRETHREALGGDFETAWEQALNRGIVAGTAQARERPPRAEGAVELPETKAAPELTVLFQPDPTIRDGRWANHAWLQELPKPQTQMVWDNAAHISPRFATQRGLKNGDVVRLRTAAGTVEAPVWVLPGLAAGCVLVHLGYGRTHAGNVGTGLGFSAYRVRRASAPWRTPLLQLETTGGHATLVTTHAHYSMEGRDLVRTARAADPGRSVGKHPETPPSLYPEWKYDGYRWGMVVDLGTCIGCKACVIACQAENNIPCVGKDQVGRGREMHWLRVDHYYEGDPDNPDVLHQPVPCMQCEKAPCELVCPTAATVHSSEGLNDMVYNRCIGTRYCSNNCPYKVRRFNFLDYREPKDSTVYLQKNPEVTIRARGVMEKCNYCVQRIDQGRIRAERESRRIRDGEIRTACQQACPVDAIVFGDLSDPNSRVRARRAEPTQYALLEELNTQPRTRYLARITNRSELADPEPPPATQPEAHP